MEKKKVLAQINIYCYCSMENEMIPMMKVSCTPFQKTYLLNSVVSKVPKQNQGLKGSDFTPNFYHKLITMSVVVTA